MINLNNHKNVKIVLNKFRDIKRSFDKTYGKEFINNIFLLEAIEETKYKILGMRQGDVLFSIKPDKEMVNLRNSMHGGCIATAVDIVSTIVLSSNHKNFNHNISTKISMNFVLPVPLEKNSYILCSNIQLLENNQGFCSADVYDIDHCKLLVKSTHLKYFVDKQWI